MKGAVLLHNLGVDLSLPVVGGLVSRRVLFLQLAVEEGDFVDILKGEQHGGEGEEGHGDVKPHVLGVVEVRLGDQLLGNL